jgi:hypothetical protein
MDILVRIHVGTDWDEGVNAAKVSLDEAGIKRILQLAKRVHKGQTFAEFDNTPDLGTTDLDLVTESYKDLSKLTEEESQQATFGSKEDVRSEIVQLHVDKTDFWWGGVFKHTNIHWETRMIPLAFLPKPAVKVESGKPLPNLNMTYDQINTINEKIAQGYSHGLNAREIERTFQRHVTKAQLIR